MFEKYPSKEAFYADRGGATSPESYYGVNNTFEFSRIQRYRVSVVAETGDVYAEAVYPPNQVYLLGTIELTKNGAENYPTIYPEAFQIADNLFANWADATSLGKTLYWFEERLRLQAEIP